MTQVKGYEVGQDEYIVLEPDEIAAAIPESDKTLAVVAFIRCDAIDTVYFDRPYYLSPSNRIAEEAFALIREGLRAKKAAALARTVLFRRVQTLLIRPHGEGLVGTTLNFDYEVRSAEEAFHDIPAMTIKGEMLDLAKHIITTKRGKFDPASSTTAMRRRWPNWCAPSSKANRADPQGARAGQGRRPDGSAQAERRRCRHRQTRASRQGQTELSHIIDSGTPSAKKAAGKQKATASKPPAPAAGRRRKAS